MGNSPPEDTLSQELVDAVCNGSDVLDADIEVHVKDSKLTINGYPAPSKCWRKHCVNYSHKSRRRTHAGHNRTRKNGFQKGPTVSIGKVEVAI